MTHEGTHVTCPCRGLLALTSRIVSLEDEATDFLAAAGSLSAAARELRITPPAVSKRLSQLEGRLGVSLLTRTTRRMGLTAEGETCLAHSPNSATVGANLLFTIQVRAADNKVSENDKQDARGATTTRGGTQDASAVTDVKPDTKVEVPLVK